MIEQKDFNFSEEFLSFLPDKQQAILRRISAAFKDPRIKWEPGTQTFLVLDCLAEELTYLAEQQIDSIDKFLLTNKTVTVSKPVLTKST